jgi:hypothetical protein
MRSDEQLDALVDHWQEAAVAGVGLTPAELCRDTPELLPELERRLAVLGRFEALRSDEVAATVERPSAAATTLPDAPATQAAPPAARPSALPVVGAGFDGYLIVAELGRGGMGVVYRATNPVLKRDEALKVMLPEAAARPQARERFLREARAMAAVRHDHVVEVYHVREVDGVPYLAMPLLEGETLAARLKRDGTLPPGEVLRLGREMADGLAAAHALGLIHRDIKPTNVWLEVGTNRVKLLDFGLVRERDAASGLTGEGAVLGTPAYMSPEQVNGKALDARSDLFSVGSVLYECATGRRPFTGPTLTAVLYAVDRARPRAVRAVNPCVSSALSDLIGALLHKAPERRPESALELGRRLRALESGGPAVEEMTPTREFRHGLPWRGWPGAAVAACLLGLVLLGGVAVRKGWLTNRPSGDMPGTTEPESHTSVPGPPAAADPLRVVKIEVRHFARIGADDAEARGLLGERSFAATVGDQVTIEAKLSRPAYAYLIAFRPDGMAELCFPENEDEPPPLTDRPHYPSMSRTVRYGLDDVGTGLMVFAVVASDRPLPSYREWSAQNRPAWRPAEGKLGEVWWDDGALLDVLTPAGPARGERGKGEAALGKSVALVRLTDSLKQDRPTDAVGCLGFVVRPRRGVGKGQPRATETAMRILLLALAAILVGTAWADDPPEKGKPPYERLLQGDDAKTAMALQNKIDALEEADKYDETVQAAEELAVLRTRVQGADHWQVLDARIQVSTLRTIRALPPAERAKVREAYDANPRAVNLNDQGKYAEAQPLLEKALDITRKALGEDHPDTATSYNNLATNLDYQGRHGEAQPLHERALAIKLKALGDQHPQTALGYNNVAFNLAAQGKYAQAQPLYEKALAIWRKARGEDHPDTATGYHNLAANLNDQGKYAQAQPLFEKALAITRKALGDDHADTASGYNSVAANLDAQDKYAQAQPLYEKALDITRKVLGDQHPQSTLNYSNLAVNLHAQGKHAEALATLDRATRSYECRRLIAARGLERSVAANSHSPYPLMGALMARQGRSADAWIALERDLARGLLDQLAERRAGTLPPDEQRRYDALTDRLAAIGPRILFLLTRTQRSDAEQKELDNLSAERRRLATDLADLAVRRSQREVASLDDVRKALSADAALVAWVDVSGPGIEEHWVCVVRSTGEPLWERLPGTGADHLWTRQDTDLPARLRFALVGDRTTAPAPAAEVAALARDLYAQRLAPVEKHLDGVHRLFVVPVHAMSGVPVEVLTERYRVSYVPSGTFLVRLKDRPCPAGDRVLALGDPRFEDAVKPKLPRLPPGGLLVLQVVPNGSAAAANIKPGDVLLAYAGTDLKDLNQLQKLIADNLGDKPVPVTVWRDGRTGVREVAAGRLGVALARDPAPVALADQRKTDELIARSRGGDWKELPGTRVELARVKALFGPDRVTILADAAATEPTLEALRTGDRLKEYRYLHFATHGEANDASAFESRLVLVQDAAARSALPRAGQPTLDGYLTAREVLEFWKLDAELVTLSACETALGRAGGGDGQLGFAQAFLTAGSRSVCLSLWKVDDAATALLMDRFYQNLTGKREGLKAPLGKAEALSEAKDWLRNLSLEEATQRLGAITDGVARGKGQEALKVAPPAADPKADPKQAKPFAHPKYWAAFVLIGDPN